jgi:hypothetical protein
LSKSQDNTPKDQFWDKAVITPIGSNGPYFPKNSAFFESEGRGLFGSRRISGPSAGFVPFFVFFLYSRTNAGLRSEAGKPIRVNTAMNPKVIR